MKKGKGMIDYENSCQLILFSIDQLINILIVAALTLSTGFLHDADLGD